MAWSILRGRLAQPGRALVVLLAILALLPQPALAAADYLLPGFVMPADRKPVVLVVYPSILMSRQGVEGFDAAWTTAAHANLRAALAASAVASVAELRFMDEQAALASEVYPDLLQMHYQRTGAIIFKVPQESSDITKAKKCKCAYDFRPLHGRVLTEQGPADYALMINQMDTYATTGQILGEIAGATADGIFQPSGIGPMRRMRVHAGNAVLFDLKTGDVIWMHGDGAFGGDLRDPKGAQVRINQAISRFPGTKR